MKPANNTEMAKWRWYALAVTVLGIILFSLPWIPTRYKYFLTIPLYAMFVYVYYKYMCIKKEAQAAAAAAKEASPAPQKTSSGQNKKPAQKGKATTKKG